MRGFFKIFSFTFKQRIKSRSYVLAIFWGTLLCIFLPAAIMPAVEYFSKEDTYENRITKIYVIDKDAEHPADYSVLNSTGDEVFCDITYETAQDVDSAAAEASKEEYAAILAVSQQEETYQLRVLLPEETQLKREDANAFEEFVTQYFRYILVQKSGLEAGQIADLTAPISVSSQEYSNDAADADGNDGFYDASKADESDDLAEIKEIFSYVLPYINVMVLYFMALAYGQGCANCTIMEKNSKLMDLFLVSADPGAMLLGKVFATTVCAIVQLFCWIGGLIGGFALGTWLVRMVNPQTDMLLIQLFDSFGMVSGMFTLPGVVTALLILAAGLLLYCSLAAIGGAISEKPEDLSNANGLFVMILIISFFAVLYTGGTEVPWDAVTWQVWMPFTAIMTAPAKVLLGAMTPLQGLLSLAIIVAAAVVITLLAGRLYRMMAFYKGNVPSPKKLLEMLRQERKGEL